MSELPILNELDAQVLLALMIRAESDSEPRAGQIAVAHVPLTRLKSRPWRYGHSLKDVLLKPYAFSCFNHSRHWAPFWPPTPAYITIAELAIEGLLNNPAPGATHYYNPAIADPSWAPAFTHVATIGRHYFLWEPQ